jgi:hypothetical protein
MKRGLALAILAVCILAGGRAFFGCGSGDNGSPDTGTPPTLDSFFPADNAVAGWVEDTSLGHAGVEVYASSDSSAINSTPIDGDLDPFQQQGFKALGLQYYKLVGDAGVIYKLQLRLWQMNNATGASTIYDNILTARDPYKVMTNWTDVSIGDKGRAGNSGTQWIVDSRKLSYFAEARLTTSDDTDTAGRDQAEAVLKSLVDRLQ